jgi:aryl-alcohol dehydrogenase-like predicted oxidoreductase
MLAAGPLTCGAQSGGSDEQGIVKKVPSSVLGRTGVEVGRLAIGCAWFQRKRVTPEDVAKTLDRAIELGVNYLDTAPSYGSEELGWAEEKMGHAIPAIRDKVFLVTKTHEPTYDGTMKLLEQSLKRMKTDRLDLVHLHNFGDAKVWSDVAMILGPKGALAALKKAREEKVIRFIGATGHVFPARFHQVIDTGEIDVLMNAVNFITRHTYDFEHKVWTRAKEKNLGLVAMKVLGGGTSMEGGYAIPKEHYERAIRYALSVPGISTAVIGLENVSELEQAAAIVSSAKPFSEDEARETAKLGLELAAEKDWKAPYGEPVT